MHLSGSKKNLLFPLLLVLYEVATYLSNDMYLPALPEMMTDLGLTAKQAQLTLTTWFLGQASMPFFMGAISDRFGRRPVVLIGGVIYILATILCAIATSGSMLLIGRFIEGGVVASMLVAGYACIHELYDTKEAVRMLALMGSIAVLAPALGPLFGSIILLFTSWRGIFWVIAFIATISIALLYRYMPETLAPENRQPIHLLSLIRNYGHVIINVRFMLLMFVLGLIFTGFIAWISAGSLLVIQQFQYSAIAFGVIQAIIFSAYIIGNHWVKYLLEWIGIKYLIRTGLIITFSGGLLMLLFAILLPDSLYAFLLAMTLYSFGSSLCFAPLNRSIIEESDEAMGIRVAVFTVFLTMSAALGSALSSIFYDGSIASLAYIITTVITLSCLLYLCFSVGDASTQI